LQTSASLIYFKGKTPDFGHNKVSSTAFLLNMLYSFDILIGFGTCFGFV